MELRDRLYDTATKLSISETNLVSHIFTIKITSADYSWSHIFVDKTQMKELRDYINSKLESEPDHD